MRTDSTAKSVFSKRSRKTLLAAIEQLESRTLFSDTTAPLANVDPIPQPTVGGTYQDFTVHYSDDTAVDTSSIETGNILIIGPHNYTATPALLSVSGSGANVTATYRMLAPGLAPGSIDFNQPGGTWDGYDDGQYNFYIEPNSVKDTSGNAMANQQVTMYAVSLDHIPPTVTVGPITAPSAGAGSMTFTITYQDNVRVRPATLNVGEVTVTGPDGYSQTATYLNPIPVPHADSITPTYEITAPNGGFVAGQYAISLHGVTDISGNPEPTGVIGTFNIDQIGPTASLAVGDPARGASGLNFTVTYTGPAAINASTLDSNDITVTGPNSFSALASFVSTSGSGDTVSATYHINAPGGSFDPSDAGSYTIHTNAAQVADNNGDYVASGVLGSFDVAADTTAPTAALTPVTSPTAHAQYVDFTVTYNDDFQMNASSLGDGDVQVLGSHGFSSPANLISKTPSSDGTSVTAVYRVLAPGGAFTSSTNGTYSVVMNSGTVTDSSGNAVAANTLGTFVVNVDTTAPVAALTSIDEVTGGLAAINFTITYSDDVGVDPTSVDDNDVTVTGPNNFAAAATLISKTPSPSGLTLIAVYQVDAPNGAFTTATNGTYTIAVDTSAVTDTSANPVPAGPVGTFEVNVDTTAPEAALSSVGSVANDDPYVDFVITFSDNLDVDPSTLAGAVVITGPAGFSATPTLISTAPGTAPSSGGTAIDATYRLSSPRGYFSSKDDGTYTISLQDKVVKDTDGNPIAATSLGNFAINITPIDAPDLTGSVTSIPTTVKPNVKKNKVTLSIANDGDRSIKKSVPVTLYASPTASFDSSTALLLTTTNAKLSLNANRSKAFSFNFASPKNVTADNSYYIIAVIDPNKTITEQSKANDTLVSSGTSAFQKAFVDLSATVLTLPKKISAHKSATVKLKITNNGNVQADGNSNIQLAASTSPSFDALLTQDLSEVTKHLKLNPGSSETISLKVPAGALPAGESQYFEATATFLGLPAESNDSNNSIFSTQAISVTT